MNKTFFYSIIFNFLLLFIFIATSPILAKENHNSYIEVLNDNTPILFSENAKLTPKAYVERGEIYSFKREYGSNWYEVEVGGKTGYIYKGAAKRVSTIPSKVISSSSIQLNGITTNKTNVYDNSKRTLQKIGAIEANQLIGIVSDYGNWYRVSFLNREAYIHKRDVKLNFSQQHQYFRVDKPLEIKVRENGKLITKGSLMEGSIYKRISDYGPNWHKIEFGDKDAFVYKHHTTPINGTVKNKSISVKTQTSTITFNEDAIVYDNSTGKLTPIAEVLKGTEYSIAKDYGNWWGINLSGYLGYVHKSAVNLNIIDSDYFQIISSSAAININENGTLKRVGTLNEGQIYKKIRDYGPNWYEIEFGNRKAYVYKKNTKPIFGDITNKSINSSNKTSTITFKEDAKVYDNATGKLVPIAEVLKGTEYSVAKNYGNWWGINLSGYLGYVHKSAVILNIKESEYFQVISSSTAININENGKLKRVGTLNKGQIYKKIRDYGPNWYEIEFGNRKAYVYKKNTKLIIGNITNKSINSSNKTSTITFKEDAKVYDNATGKLVPIAEVLKGTEYSVAKNYGNWWGINISGYLGYVHKSAVSLNIKESEYFQVISSSAAVNINENGKLKRVGTLNKGQIYKKIRDYGPNWYEIQFGNQKGYVYKTGTILVEKSRFTSQSFVGDVGAKVVKTIYNTNVFDNQGGKLKQIGTINKGTEYPILSDYGKWYRIVYANRIAYIHKSGVRDLFNDNDKTFQMLSDATIFQNRNGKLIAIGELKQGQFFERVKDYGNWHQLKFANETAFVWKDATQPAKYSSANKINNNKLRIIKRTPIFEDYKTKNVALTLEPGIDVPLKRTVNDEWFEINLFGRDLYVEAKNVTTKEAIIIENHENFHLIKQHLLQGPLVKDISSTPINETVEAADLILSGKINFPDYGIIDISKGINWKSGGSGIRDQHQNSYLRQLHGFFFINDLAEAFYITGNRKYLDKGYEIIRDWQEANPRYSPEHRMAWHDEGTARRLNALINYYHASQGILNPEQLNNLYDMITAHAILLLDEEFYSENTNHGMFQDQALIAFSKYFYSESKYDYIYERALNRLETYYDSLISDDYVHLEHSPSYHQVIASSLRRFSNVLRSFNDVEAAEKFNDLYLNMVDYGIHVIKPDGNWPLIGDTYSFSNPPNRNMWDDLRYQYAVSRGKYGEKPALTNVVYPSAGYAIFRNSWDIEESETYLFFTAAYHTSYHKHSDDLSFWLYHKKDLITEAGPFSYQLSDPTTAYAYSSFGHNSLIVNDRGLPRVDGKYDKTKIINFDIDNKNNPHVTGINERFENVTHKRTINYNKESNVITVDDSMESGVRNNYKLLWHIAPNITPKVDEVTNAVYLQDGNIVLAEMKFYSDSPLKMNIFYGDNHEKYKGLYFAEKSNMQEVDIVDTFVIVVELEDKNANVQTEISLK